MKLHSIIIVLVLTILGFLAVIAAPASHVDNDLEARSLTDGGNDESMPSPRAMFTIPAFVNQPMARNKGTEIYTRQDPRDLSAGTEEDTALRRAQVVLPPPNGRFRWPSEGAYRRPRALSPRLDLSDDDVLTKRSTEPDPQLNEREARDEAAESYTRDVLDDRSYRHAFSSGARFAGNAVTSGAGNFAGTGKSFAHDKSKNNGKGSGHGQGHDQNSHVQSTPKPKYHSNKIDFDRNRRDLAGDDSIVLEERRRLEERTQVKGDDILTSRDDQVDTRSMWKTVPGTPDPPGRPRVTHFNWKSSKKSPPGTPNPHRRSVEEVDARHGDEVLIARDNRVPAKSSGKTPPGTPNPPEGPRVSDPRVAASSSRKTPPGTPNPNRRSDNEIDGRSSEAEVEARYWRSDEGEAPFESRGQEDPTSGTGPATRKAHRPNQPHRRSSDDVEARSSDDSLAERSRAAITTREFASEANQGDLDARGLMRIRPIAFSFPHRRDVQLDDRASLTASGEDEDGIEGRGRHSHRGQPLARPRPITSNRARAQDTVQLSGQRGNGPPPTGPHQKIYARSALEMEGRATSDHHNVAARSALGAYQTGGPAGPRILAKPCHLTNTCNQKLKISRRRDEELALRGSSTESLEGRAQRPQEDNSEARNEEREVKDSLSSQALIERRKRDEYKTETARPKTLSQAASPKTLPPKPKPMYNFSVLKTVPRGAKEFKRRGEEVAMRDSSLEDRAWPEEDDLEARAVKREVGDSDSGSIALDRRLPPFHPLRQGPKPGIAGARPKFTFSRFRGVPSSTMRVPPGRVTPRGP